MPTLITQATTREVLDI